MLGDVGEVGEDGDVGNQLNSQPHLKTSLQLNFLFLQLFHRLLGLLYC